MTLLLYAMTLLFCDTNYYDTTIYYFLLVQSALKGKVRAAEVTWVGSGTWTVDNICFDWDDSAYNVWVCTGSGLGLTEGQMMNLECSESSMTSCP